MKTSDALRKCAQQSARKHSNVLQNDTLLLAASIDADARPINGNAFARLIERTCTFAFVVVHSIFAAAM